MAFCINCGEKLVDGARFAICAEHLQEVRPRYQISESKNILGKF